MWPLHWNTASSYSVITCVAGGAEQSAPCPAAIGWTAAIMLAAMLVFGVAVYSFGVNDLRPGIGGNIGYLIAMLVVFYFLLPSALAVPIHWLSLRAAVKPRE